MLWVVIVISLISVLLRKFERTIGIISFLLISFIVGHPNYIYNGDANVYRLDYIYGLNSFEKGYNFITNFAINKMDYTDFRIYSSIIVYLILSLLILLFTRHVSTISLFYAISMFPFDNQQVRNVMAALFILFGGYLLFKFGKKAFLLSLLSIFIGSFFHSLSLFFLILPVLWIFKTTIVKKFVTLFSIASIVTFIFELLGSTGIIPILTTVLNKLGSRASASDNVATVYNHSISIYTWIAFYIVTLFMAYTVYSLKNYILKQNVAYYDMAIVTIFMWMGGMLLITISPDYVRILRIISLFYFIFMAEVFSQHNINKSKIFIYSLTMSFGLLIIQLKVYGINFEIFKGIIGLN